MHAEPSIRDDATLLARWALEKNEDAFAEIVRQYERLVLGAALRRTADMELARDVAQQVFATLAAKARLLLDRKNIAGWLYHATNHIASRSAQSERRRLAHQQSFEGADNGRRGCDGHALVIEEALAAIGATEREALLLHYFQDLAYPEIAAALGIEEPAARKRVSRGLHRLEKEMRRRGLRGSSAALLTSIAAQQSVFSSHAGLAATAIAAGTPTSARWLAWSTMISSAPVKALAGASALAIAPLLMQWPVNAKLRAEIGELRKTPAALVVATARATEPRIQMELAAKRSARIAAENRISELAALQEKLNDEVVISLGTIETMARKLARVVSNMNQLETKSGRASDAPAGLNQRQAKARDLAAAIPEAMTIAREIPRIERDPAKAAHFYATLAGEILGLDQETRMTMRGEIADWVHQLQRDGLALIQRPRGKDLEWDRRRDAATREFIARILKEMPFQNPAGPAMLELFARNGNAGFYEFLTTEAVP